MRSNIVPKFKKPAKPQLIPSLRFVLERRRDVDRLTVDHDRTFFDPLLLGHRLVGDDVLAGDMLQLPGVALRKVPELLARKG